MIRGRLLAVLCASAGAAMTLAPSADATGLRDTFGAGREGWVDAWEDVAADWFEVGGHPGGHIVAPADNLDRAAGATERWAGNRADAYGGELSFDARFDVGESGEVYAGFRSQSVPTGADFHFAERSGGPWRHYIVPLRASAPGWDATQSELISALSDLEMVDIGVNDAGDLYIDNVTLASNVRRKLGIRYGDGAFHGKLRPRGRCAKGKRVSVFRRKPGADAKVGTDRTNSRGRYSIGEPGAKGSYYGVSRRAFTPGAGNCLAAESARERVR
jgi:hypothetical protein